MFVHFLSVCQNLICLKTGGEIFENLVSNTAEYNSNTIEQLLNTIENKIDIIETPHHHGNLQNINRRAIAHYRNTAKHHRSTANTLQTHPNTIQL